MLDRLGALVAFNSAFLKVGWGDGPHKEILGDIITYVYFIILLCQTITMSNTARPRIQVQFKCFQNLESLVLRQCSLCTSHTIV